MRKVLSALLAVLIFMMATGQVYAAVPENESISPLYTYIKEIATQFDINENTGIASCEASCYAANNYTVKIQCRLQQYTGSVWTTLKNWSVSGTRYASLDKSWAVSSGYPYRIYVIFRIYDSNGTLVETTHSTRTYNYS